MPAYFHFEGMPMFTYRMAVIAFMAASLAGCEDHEPPASPIRPVRALTAERQATGETPSLTGQVKARVEVGFAFRLDGRLIERSVNVGDSVAAGQLIGKLDPQIQQNGLRQAKASLSAAQGQLVQARTPARLAASPPPRSRTR